MNPLEKRSKLAVRCDALRRAFAWRFQAASVPYLLVAEYPKSGGTWLAQMLAEYLDIGFPRNKNISVLRPKRSVLHGHFLYDSNYGNVVCLFRDGRDIMVSAYHYLLSLNANPSLGRRIRSRLGINDVHDVRRHLPSFIEYTFKKSPVGGIRFRMRHVTWRSFVYSWVDKDVPVITYEGMLEDTAGALSQVVRDLTGTECDREKARCIAEQFSFRRQSARKPGQENTKSFLRKGIAGDWKNHFSRTAGEVFDHFAGDALVTAGYEMDRKWYRSLET